jgi:hypothetical protein
MLASGQMKSHGGNGGTAAVALRRTAKSKRASPATAHPSAVGLSPTHYASIHPGKDEPLPNEFSNCLNELEASLKMPVWFIVQNTPANSKNKCADIGRFLASQFARQKASLPKGSPIALVLDSPGGYARNAYQIANLLRKHCGGFVAVVPQYAKSAATLLALGAETIILGDDAELGPLDAQTFDSNREEPMSALDEVQSVERLFASSLEAVDQTMQLLVGRTGKKVEVLLAPVLHFVSEMMKPLFEKIDTVHYTQYSRVLKVAEEYAIRLLVPKYTPPIAKEIARRLVERYPEHGFVIDSIEASKIGLQISAPTVVQAKIMERMIPFLNQLTVSGKLEKA